jgi:hypothetical protein
MTAKQTFILLCFFAPFLAGAGTLDIYGSLTGKTVLMPSAMPALPDLAPSDLPPDKTNAIASIERALAEKGLEIVQDGPHFGFKCIKGAWGNATSEPVGPEEHIGLRR